MAKQDPLTEYYTDLPACPTTGKISFKNRRIPPGFRKYHRSGGRKKAQEMESYKCPDCPYYHLTKNRPKYLRPLKRPPSQYIARKRGKLKL